MPSRPRLAPQPVPPELLPTAPSTVVVALPASHCCGAEPTLFQASTNPLQGSRFAPNWVSQPKVIPNTPTIFFDCNADCLEHTVLAEVQREVTRQPTERLKGVSLQDQVFGRPTLLSFRPATSPNNGSRLCFPMETHVADNVLKQFTIKKNNRAAKHEGTNRKLCKSRWLEPLKRLPGPPWFVAEPSITHNTTWAFWRVSCGSHPHSLSPGSHKHPPLELLRNSPQSTPPCAFSPWP